MTREGISYLIFGIVLILALGFDLGLISKRNKTVSIKKALAQTLFWVALAVGFFVVLWLEKGQKTAVEYVSAYLMEWSLSIDNIFVFILVFSSFAVKEQYYSRVLLIGILMAVLLRVIFITVGVALVNEFEWILFIFGAFLVYTGVRMFIQKEDSQFKPHESKVYKFLQKIIPLTTHDGGGNFFIKENGKNVYTTLFVVVILLASVDLVFAVDSIPAVMGISREKLVIYTSNIFAVLGLRSLFFLLRGAVNEFTYLQQGIAVVLFFIGVKMFLDPWLSGWINKETQAFISLGVIIVCILSAIGLSVLRNRREQKK